MKKSQFESARYAIEQIEKLKKLRKSVTDSPSFLFNELEQQVKLIDSFSLKELENELKERTIFEIDSLIKAHQEKFDNL